MGGKYGARFDIAELREDGKYRMWLSWRPKKSVALVESTDGIHWSEPPQPVLAPRKETGWEDGACYKPYAIFDGTKGLLWYNGRHDSLEHIGVVFHDGEDLGFQ